MRDLSLVLIIFLISHSAFSKCDESVMKSSVRDEERISTVEILKRSMTRMEFCEVLTEFHESFKNDVAKKLKSSFKLKGYWASSYPQAQAEQFPEAWTGRRPESHSIVVNGAVLNQKIRSKNALRILLCHELGHILVKQVYNMSKDKNLLVKPEGYADFFATNYCLKKLNEVAMLNLDINDMEKAAYNFSLDSGFANDEAHFPEGQFDFSESTKLVTEHSYAKCRYTTLIVGLENKKLSKTGLPQVLPRCWFKP